MSEGHVVDSLACEGRGLGQEVAVLLVRQGDEQSAVVGGVQSSTTGLGQRGQWEEQCPQLKFPSKMAKG